MTTEPTINLAFAIFCGLSFHAYRGIKFRKKHGVPITPAGCARYFAGHLAIWGVVAIMNFLYIVFGLGLVEIFNVDLETLITGMLSAPMTAIGLIIASVIFNAKENIHHTKYAASRTKTAWRVRYYLRYFTACIIALAAPAVLLNLLF